MGSFPRKLLKDESVDDNSVSLSFSFGCQQSLSPEAELDFTAKRSSRGNSKGMPVGSCWM